MITFWYFRETLIIEEIKNIISKLYSEILERKTFFLEFKTIRKTSLKLLWKIICKANRMSLSQI